MDSNNDIGSMLSKLLEDPAALSSVMSIAGNLMNNLPKDSFENQASPEDDVKSPDDSINIQPEKADITQSQPSNTTPHPDLSALSALAGLGLGNGTNKKSDPRCNLLNSLRPYMSHGRAEKIDMMIKALNLAELAGGFLNNKKLF